MLRFLSDENFNGDIIRGMRLRRPELDLARVQDSGLQGIEDPEILEWAVENDRVVLTHDRSTMPDFAYERLVSKQKMAGMFLVNDRMATRQAIDELL
jgi:predicted nuclease of predicted toxin-antitoxin system